jgi:hypothetical protein
MIRLRAGALGCSHVTDGAPMKIAYVFVSPRAASYKLGKMILPQLEAGTHGVEVVGMFFFDDNVFALRAATRSASGSRGWRPRRACC